MAGNTATLTVKVLTDAKGAQAGISAASSKFDRFRSGISRLTPAALAVGAGLAVVGKKALTAASDLQQANGAVESVFGSAAAAVDKYARTSVDRLGLSEAAYKNYASLVGAALQNAGFSAQQAADMSDKAMVRAADMAATYGGKTSDAIDAINAAVSRGEFDPLEKYAVSLNQTAVNAELAKRGQSDLTGAALKQAKAQATLDLIYQQTGKAAGQFAREQDTLAVKQQQAGAAFENAAAALGEVFLPAATKVMTVLTSLAGWMGKNQTAVLAIVGAFAAFSAIILTLNAAMKIYQATMIAITVVQKAWTVATKAAAVAQRLLNLAMAANPIGLLIAAITLAVAAIVLLWKKHEGFRNAVIAIWHAIGNVAKAVWQGIKVAISTVIGWAKGFLSGFRSVAGGVFRGIGTVGKAAWRGIQSVGRGSVNALKAGLRGFASVGKAIWRAHKYAAQQSWNGAKIVARAATAAIKGLLRGLAAVARAVWAGIRTAAAAAFRAISSVVRSVVSAIKGLLTGVRSTAVRVWNSVRSAASSAFRAILGPINAVKSAIDSVISAVQSLISKLGSIKVPKINLPSLPFSATAPSSPAMAYATTGGMGVRSAPTLAGVSSRLRASGGALTGGGPIVINVSGTLNDVDAANAVRRVLRNDQRRRSGVTIDRTRQGLV